MKLKLVVLTPGKLEGKEVPITLSQFVIGRDHECNLRPASALISKRHCALLIRNNKVFLRDFKSTNGTYVNEERVEGQRALENGDRLRVGPLLFRVDLEVSAPVDKPTPMPPTRMEAASADEDAAAALLLSLQESGDPSGSEEQKQDISSGSTIMEVMTTLGPDGSPQAEPSKPDEKKASKPKMMAGDTSTAAKAILEKYIRRPRSS